MSAGGFLNEQGRAFQCRDGVVRVNAALEQERRLGVKVVAACCFADVCWVEAGALDEHRCGAVADARFQSAEHSGNAHWLVGVANHKVFGVERALNTVERGEFCSGRHCLHNHFVTVDFIGIEGVKRLTELVQNEVRNIDNIVYRVQAHRFKTFLQPLGRRCNLDARNRNACVAAAAFVFGNLDAEWAAVVVNLERANVGNGVFCWFVDT